MKPFKEIWYGFLEGKCLFDGCEELQKEFQKDLADAGCCGQVSAVEKWKKKLKDLLNVS